MYDLIGDIHGCLPELLELLDALGYDRHFNHPQGCQAVFLGDLVDRGPDTPGVLRLVLPALDSGAALCVQGNHDWRLAAYLHGKPVKLSPGIHVSLEQLHGESQEFLDEVATALSDLPSFLELDDGRLLVVHAGDRADLPPGERAHYRVHGRDLGRTSDGVLLREDWVNEYAESALVVYGHTPVPRPVWSALNAAGGRTVNIDTGCVFGGALSALRYPELEPVSVPAQARYAVSKQLEVARRRND